MPLSKELLLDALDGITNMGVSVFERAAFPTTISVNNQRLITYVPRAGTHEMVEWFIGYQ